MDACNAVPVPRGRYASSNRPCRNHGFYQDPDSLPASGALTLGRERNRLQIRPPEYETCMSEPITNEARPESTPLTERSLPRRNWAGALADHPTHYLHLFAI